jgi:hypothetical protein
MRECIPDYGVVSAAEDAPIVLAGPPRALSGRIALRNPGDEKAVLRRAVLTVTDESVHVPATEHGFARVVLSPAEERALPLRIAIDPSTPPGEYRAELFVAGRSHAALLQVADVLDVTVAPSRIVIESRPGIAQTRRLVLTNAGNIAFSVGDIGEVSLRDERFAYHAGRALDPSWRKGDDAGVDDFLVAVLRAAQEEAERTGSLTVRNMTGEVEIPPGASATVELAITVPEGLHLDSRYRAVVPVLTKDLQIVVSPTFAGTKTPRRAARTPSAPRKRTTAAPRKATKGRGGRS